MYNSYYGYNYRYGSDYGIAEVVAGIAAFIFIGIFVSYIINSILLMNLFKRAGINQGYAWIPIYNNWKFLEIGGVPGFYSIIWMLAFVTYPLLLIPFVGFIFAPLTGVVAALTGTAFVIATRNISKKLGRDEIWLTALGVTPVANIAWFLVLLSGSNRWEDSKADPSLAEGTIIGYAVEEIVETTKETTEAADKKSEE